MFNPFKKFKSRPICLVGWILVSTIYSAIGYADGEELELKIGAFQTPQFKVGNGEYLPLKMNGEYHPEFLQRINSDNEASAKLKHSETSSGITLAGSVVLLAGTVVLLRDTLDEADAASEGKTTSNDGSEALGLVILGGTIALIGGSMYRGDISDAVSIYNRNRNMSPQSNNQNKRVKPSFLFAVSPSQEQSQIKVGLRLQF